MYAWIAGLAAVGALVFGLRRFLAGYPARRESLSQLSPREVAFLKQLPMTATGKIMRRVLRNQGP